MPFPKIRRDKDLPTGATDIRLIQSTASEALNTLQDLRTGDPDGGWGDGPEGRLQAIKALMGDLYEIEQIAKRLLKEAVDLSIT